MRDNDLIQNLQFAESNLLSILENAPMKLTTYRETWSALANVLHNGIKTGNIHNETLLLAHSVASRIATISGCFLDIRHAVESSTALLQNDCQVMVRRMAALDLNANSISIQPENERDTHPPSYSDPPVHNSKSSSPPFLATAHQWLMDNLHNPYPTAEIKARIAATFSCQVSSVNSWFVNARRRIGWTALCREHFSNCKADMVDAAHRALVKDDTQRLLPPGLRHSFIAMKVAAENLYSATLTKSAYSKDLGVMVKDMMEKGRDPAEGRKGYEAEREKFTETNRDAYPSPDPCITSPLPVSDDSNTDISEEEEDMITLIIAGSKRRRSFVEPPDSRSPPLNDRPIKRLRSSMVSQTYLPSPPSSAHSIDELPNHTLSEASTPMCPTTQSETSEVLSPHQQCVSDPHSSAISKSMTGLCPHITSGPHMENGSSIDDWFNTNFDDLFAIPPPADVTKPDCSTSWEVELFKGYSLPPAPTLNTQAPATELDDLEGLLRSIGGSTSAALSQTMPPSDTADSSNTPSSGPLIPDVSDIDWTSLLNTTETDECTIHSIYTQFPINSQPLSEVDLSILQLPHATPTADSQGDLASKEVKLQRLHDMQEAVRRMEQELQSEGILM